VLLLTNHRTADAVVLLSPNYLTADLGVLLFTQLPDS
jgi:hypothetical protein